MKVLALTPKVKLAAAGALVLIAFLYTERKKVGAAIGITVDCDPTNPGACSGPSATGGDPSAYFSNPSMLF